MAFLFGRKNPRPRRGSWRAVPVRLPGVGDDRVPVYEITGPRPRKAELPAVHDVVRSVVAEGACALVPSPFRAAGGPHHFLDCVGDCAALPNGGDAGGEEDWAGTWLVGPRTVVAEVGAAGGVAVERIAVSQPVTTDYGRLSHLWNGSWEATDNKAARTLGEALGRTFAQTHGQGFFHGDARPDTLLFQKDGTMMFSPLASFAGARFVCPSAPPSLFASDLVHLMEPMVPAVWQAFRKVYTAHWPGGRQVVEFVERSGHPTWQAAVEAENYLDGLKRIDEILAVPTMDDLERMNLLSGKALCLSQLGHPQGAADAHKEALRLAIKEGLPVELTDQLRCNLAICLSLAGDSAAALSTLMALTVKARKGTLEPRLQELVEQILEDIERRR